ncbi:MAG: Rpn family recombination-promoting nuclease/putative transposase, partial [Firmicutes bacterium]|nr:Rpn family recombination-promoting nuclease/putative transposase [Bacillota bacterium]
MTRGKREMTSRLLPLTNDLVFKAVYGRNTEASNAALIALLNRLLGKEEDPIVWLHLENPFSYRIQSNEKEIILDIKVRLSSGELLDLEMQVHHLSDYINRSIFYMGKLVNESLESGEDYDMMRKTIIISIVDGTLFPQYEKAFITYCLKEEETNHKLSEITQIHFLELGKIDINGKNVMEMTPHERLGAYFKYAADESKSEVIDQLLEYEAEVIDLTKPILEEISAEQELRELEEARKRYRYDVNTARSVGHREGKEEGIGIGKEIGRTEGERIKLIQLVCKKI